MCDGITQGRAGMELSLFSRDLIAMSTAVALSHDMFDAAMMLGVCDKIVPGLLIGALSFGHLPTVFVPAGPMTSGLPNGEKARVRQLYAEGKVGREELLEAESASYHSKGTCTFYGTANSNQMLMEVMGLHLPDATFANPGTPLRAALDRAAGARAVAITARRRRAHPGRAPRRREGDRQRVRRPARDRRLDQPHHAPRRDRRRRGHHPHLGRPVRPVGRRAAADADLPQRLRGHQPLRGRRRYAVPDAHAAQARLPPRRRPHGLGPGPVAPHPRGAAGRGSGHLGGGPEVVPGHRRAARGRRAVRPGRRPADALGPPRPRGHEDLRRQARAPRRDRARRWSSTTRPTSSPPSPRAASTAATWSRSSATRARPPTACPSCTS